MKNHDDLLFQGAAQYYSRFRKGYPPFFFDFLVNHFKLNGQSRVLDLGTGTGQIAIPIAGLVGEVVAVDPDKEMLDEGKRLAQDKGILNISWVNCVAEELPTDLGLFDLITMGASFHWMEQDKVLEEVYGLTKPGGGIAIVSNTDSIYRNTNNEPWKTVAQKVIEKYLGEKRRAGGALFEGGKERFEDIIKRSKFSDLEHFNREYFQDWTIEQILGFLSSTSFASRRLLGDRINDFENELRAKLLKINSSGVFTEQAKVEALIACKK